MRRLRTLIFDFDGTIGDTLPIIYGCIKELIKRYGLKKISRQEFKALRGKESKEIIFRYLNIRFWKFWKYGLIAKIMKDGRDLFYEKRENIRPYTGMLDIINKLSKNHEILVLSSNKKETIYSIFNRWNFRCNGIYHNIRLFGKHYELKKIIKEHGWKDYSKKFIYIGDETRDIYASRKAGIEMLAVTWGLNNEKALLNAKIKPDHIVHSPAELPVRIKYIEDNLWLKKG